MEKGREVVGDLDAVVSERFSFHLFHHPYGFQERINRIQREYALRMVMEQTKKDGFEVIDQTKETDGSVRIVVRRWV